VVELDGEAPGLFENLTAFVRSRHAIEGEEAAFHGQRADHPIRFAHLQRHEQVLGVKAHAADGVDEGQCARGRPEDVETGQ
jgi:hypothetical protein